MALRSGWRYVSSSASCNSPGIETYRQPDTARHPGHGRLGPDLAVPAADLEEAVELLLSYPNPRLDLRDVLVDQHVMVGVGNVYRSEVLWATELSPWAHVGDLSQADVVMIVNTTAKLLRAGRHGSHHRERIVRTRRVRPQRPALLPGLPASRNPKNSVMPPPCSGRRSRSRLRTMLV